ncbi:MAG: 1-aminocyclopropane-1-carboxylate deaminase (EC [uncultured Thiotrichaceae bacterium]|uniref:1-aminocyclopropane-1-carboxylate deaminase (EC) n=1 Tax=uncultured Thiotrichaceae bacterium TaxID=298394 RepID=A0A6S6SLW9_9GAMM|nr:MAG: 1-aminocyclopropane-1-carboxylate deaminase (EC [uncultured Thiotrichaceae bacterium]
MLLAPPALYFHDLSFLSPIRGLTFHLVTIDSPKGLGAGNKQFKIHLNLQLIKQQGYQSVVSFGGAYSNHISALAEACQRYGFSCVGIIRGEEHYADNETLSKARQAGMTLKFVDRKTYRQRNDPDYLQKLRQAYPEAYLLPEGGSNTLAVQGCELLAQQVNKLLPKTTVMSSACGTGGTVAGLIRGARQEQRVLGFSVLKDPELGQRVSQYVAQGNHADYDLIAADFGGYAKVDIEHLQFIEAWYEETGVLLDPIYSSKMCRALLHRVKEFEFSERDVVSIIHTGGLQGWWGMKKRVKQLGKQTLWNETIEPYLRDA